MLNSIFILEGTEIEVENEQQNAQILAIFTQLFMSLVTG